LRFSVESLLKRFGPLKAASLSQAPTRKVYQDVLGRTTKNSRLG
jgi:hypothetical protein